MQEFQIRRSLNSHGEGINQYIREHGKARKGNTSTIQSRSTVTPNASPDNLSTDPANTSTKNQGRRSTDDAKVEGTVWARIIIATDNK